MGEGELKDNIQLVFFAVIIGVVVFFVLNSLPTATPASELLALRLELDLNMARGEGFQEGYAYAQFLCQGDVNALRQACQQELGAIVAECNSRLEACEK
ncbi:MAG TPA: hypothetical protein VMW25_01120 [Clostridia bacterium]|nr:hypothetical protein [Clostridia bacterium]